MTRKRKKSSRAQGIFPTKKKQAPDPFYGMATKPKYPTGFQYHTKKDEPDEVAVVRMDESTGHGEAEDKSDDQSDPRQ